MEMMKVLILGAGGYLIWQYMQSQGSAVFPGGPAAPAPGEPTTPPAGAATLMNADHWNWIRQQAEGGKQQPAPESFGFTGAGRFEQVTREEYDRRRAAAGLAGIVRTAWR